MIKVITFQVIGQGFPVKTSAVPNGLLRASTYIGLTVKIGLDETHRFWPQPNVSSIC